jgi:hypothetical protein
MIQIELGRGVENGSQISIKNRWERNTSDRREGYVIIGTKK